MIFDKIVSSLTRLNLRDSVNIEKVASFVQVVLFLLLALVIAVTIKNGLLFYFSKDKIYLRSVEDNSMQIEDQISLNWVQKYVEPKPKPKVKPKVKKQRIAPKVAQKPKRSRLSFKPRLVGIIYNSEGKGVALFVEGSSQVPYLEGSLIKNIKIKKINQHSIELEEEGYVEIIEIPNNEVKLNSETDDSLPLDVGLSGNVNNTNQVTQKKTPSNTRTLRKQATQRKMLPVEPAKKEEPQEEKKIEAKVTKQVFERVVQDPSFLLKNVTIKPTKGGLSIRFNQNSLALANRLGLKQADVIMSVNSIPLDNPANYFKLQQLVTKSLRGNDPLNIVVKRAGQIINLKLNN